MQFDLVKQKLDTELEVNKLGDLRKFRFIKMHLNSNKETINFFITVLNYKKWQANQIAYIHEYNIRRNKLKKHLIS